MINSDIILGDFVGCSGTWTWKESCGTLVYLMGKGGSSNQRHLGVFITGYQAPVTMDRVREDILSGSKHGGFHKWGYPHSWMVSNGKSNEIGWFRGTPILGNPHMLMPVPLAAGSASNAFIEKIGIWNTICIIRTPMKPHVIFCFTKSCEFEYGIIIFKPPKKKPPKLMELKALQSYYFHPIITLCIYIYIYTCIYTCTCGFVEKYATPQFDADLPDEKGPNDLDGKASTFRHSHVMFRGSPCRKLPPKIHRV